MIAKLSPVLLVLLALSFGGVIVYASLDTSGYPRAHKEREWKDAQGQVIKRIDPRGRMYLLTWDGKGRLVRIEGIARRVDPRTTEGTVPSGAAWVHCFAYDDKGLAQEIDCVGTGHLIGKPIEVDPRVGTALTNHRHVQEAGTQAPSEAAGKCVEFKYDDQGRLVPKAPGPR